MQTDPPRRFRRVADPTEHHHQAQRQRACEVLYFSLPDIDQDVLAWLVEGVDKTPAQLLAGIIEHGLRRCWEDAMARADHDDLVRFPEPTRVVPRDSMLDNFDIERRNGTAI